MKVTILDNWFDWIDSSPSPKAAIPVPIRPFTAPSSRGRGVRSGDDEVPRWF